jgi:DAK2 domain fusion protein YloV
MYMTIAAGTEASGKSLSEMAASASRLMLLGARGNSGVILSRIFAGLAKGFEGAEEADIQLFTSAMQSAVDEAYHAVTTPVEGTILTVLREGVDAASGAASLEEYLDRAAAAMDISVQHTPELLDVLKKAGVVDSGGAGLLLIVEGMRAVLRGETVLEVSSPAATAQKVDFNAFTEDSVLEFGYCTEFLLRLQRAKVDLERFDESVIRDYLLGQGDSLVFFRDGSIIKVHVHTMDPGAVLSHCRQWGEFLTIKVENMTLQHHENHMDERFHRERKAVGIVSVATGAGLTAAFREMGADEVIEGGQTLNPPVESFLKAFDAVNAETILVFPNNSNILLTARQAASLYDKSRIEVIPTRTLGEGYFSLGSLDTSLSEEEMIAALTQAAEAVTTGLVSKAIRDSEQGRAGDYLGLSGKEILSGDAERVSCLLQLAEALHSGEHDIAVLFFGEDVAEAEAQQAQRLLSARFPHTETILMDGGQSVYDYILILS